MRTLRRTHARAIGALITLLGLVGCHGPRSSQDILEALRLAVQHEAQYARNAALPHATGPLLVDTASFLIQLDSLHHQITGSELLEAIHDSARGSNVSAALKCEERENKACTVLENGVFIRLLGAYE